jgi:hypothetical protein
MDPRTNPYSPGAGARPPELTGREDLIERAAIALDRCRNGLPSRGGLIMVGLRGVGKTVLLTRIALETEARGFAVVSVEIPEKRSLPALLIPALRSVLLKLERTHSGNHIVKKALGVLGGFVSAMKLKYKDIEFCVDLETHAGVADSGDLEHDLMELFITLGETVKQYKTALALFIDEIQYIPEDQFAALIMALHKCVQMQLPILLIGAGLPQLIGLAGRAKSYAERLFEYPEIGPLNQIAAKNALIIPAAKSNVGFDDRAIDEILKQTQCYPYFLQEWGKHCWECAEQSPVTVLDVELATKLAVMDLDTSFFRVRFDRLTPVEKKYLRAMAECGSGFIRSGDIAHLLKKEVQSVAPTRATLIEKGMIYSPSHGDNAFTVPLFQDYLKRVIPYFENNA